MSLVDDFRNLPDNNDGLHRIDEAAILQMRVDDLVRMLGAPGDWGYGTKLGELTQILRVTQTMLRRTPAYPA